MKKAFAHRRLFLISVISIALLLLVGCWLVWDVAAPKPLGTKLEYIGKEDYGCWLVCDSNPGSTYYYATDLDKESIENYFKYATYKQTPWDGESIGAGYSSRGLHFNTKSGEFILHYYNDKNSVLKTKKMKNSNGKYVISIDSEDYETIKDSL